MYDVDALSQLCRVFHVCHLCQPCQVSQPCQVCRLFMVYRGTARSKRQAGIKLTLVNQLTLRSKGNGDTFAKDHFLRRIGRHRIP